MSLPYGSWMGAILGPDENAQVQTPLPLSLTKLLAGYQVYRLFGEAVGDEIGFVRMSGIAQEVATFPERNLVLNLVTSQKALAQPGSVARTILTIVNRGSSSTPQSNCCCRQLLRVRRIRIWRFR